jgi:dynein heavy chain
MTKCTGDALLAAAFLSYMGPFVSEYREETLKQWLKKVKEFDIPCQRFFDFSDFLSNGAEVRDWQSKGLPTDKFSVENGVMVRKGQRWSLNIDPQSQASRWVLEMEKSHGITKLDLNDNDDKKIGEKHDRIKKAISHGKPVLLCDVGEELDPVLDNVLNKSTIQIGGKTWVKLGDQEIIYHKNFKLYITTRISNPHYTPEVSTKVILVNFTVKQAGLEEQLLGIIVRAESPSTEEQKDKTVQKIAQNKIELIECEDKILSSLQNSGSNLLEDDVLVMVLQDSKEKSEEVKQILEQSESMMKRIEDAREHYRPSGKQASILFFVLNDLSKIDPMYQFSLEGYKELYSRSIEESKSNMTPERLKNIMKQHMVNVYKQTCKSLFERHKLLLAVQMIVSLKMAEGEINRDEWLYFLRGGQVMDRSLQPVKPPQIDWITQAMWDNITELEKQLPETFTGVVNAVSLNPKEWQRWFLSNKPEPENASLPGEWETKCEDRLKKMIVLRCLRQDRVIHAIKNFVEANVDPTIKKEFMESKPTNLQEIHAASIPQVPIIFVLSPGVDPRDLLLNFAEKMEVEVQSTSLGKGQSEAATAYLKDGAEKGNWVYLANCHLSISLMPELEGIIEQVVKTNLDPKFRLFLSSRPHEKFPISLLQRSQLVTQEPPRGIKANMLRMYNNMSEFQSTVMDKEFKRALYGLCWFHAILIERKKFKTLGWNVSYAFNDSDFGVCEDLVAKYMGKIKEGEPIIEKKNKPPIPWTAIQFLIADANYGGRITDDRDRRLIRVYAQEIFCDSLVTAEKWKPPCTEELNYGYPIDEQQLKGQDQAGMFTPKYFFEEISQKMDAVDLPSAFGQHQNAEITSMIMDSQELLQSINSLQPQAVSEGGDSAENQVLKLILELQVAIPEPMDLYDLKVKLNRQTEQNPVDVVLV